MTMFKMKVAVAILGGSLTAAVFAIQPTAARAAECLPGPKGAAPNGSHWYYRIDRATKKNCWYVRAESSRPVPTSHVENSPRSETPLRPSVADARAEAMTDRAEPAAPPLAAPPAEQAQAADPGNAASTVAARWLDQADADTAETASASPADAAATSPALPAATAPPAPAVRSAQASGAFPTLLFVIIGALAAAAVVAGMLFRFGRARADDQQNFEREHAPWDAIDLAPAMPSPPLATGSPLAQAVPELRQHDAVIPDEIVRLLSKLSKEAPA